VKTLAPIGADMGWDGSLFYFPIANTM